MCGDTRGNVEQRDAGSRGFGGGSSSSCGDGGCGGDTLKIKNNKCERGMMGLGKKGWGDGFRGFLVFFTPK